MPDVPDRQPPGDGVAELRARHEALQQTATMPGADLRPLLDAALAELLVAFGGAALAAVSDYDEAQRTAVQLRDAADSRSLVDQAKGILMHALGCTADEALDRMRQVSQRNNMRTTEVAATIIGARAGRPGQVPRSGDAPRSGQAKRSGEAGRSGQGRRSGRPGESPRARR